MNEEILDVRQGTDVPLPDTQNLRFIQVQR